MSASRQALFWLAFVVAFLLLVALVRDVLLPFVAGMAIAYFLDPIADWFEARGLPRALATTVVLALFFLAFLAALLLILPLVQAQVVSLAARLPEFSDYLRDDVLPRIARFSNRLPADEMERVRDVMSGFSQHVVRWALSLVEDLWSSGVAIANLLGLVIITPIVAWYQLRDWDRLVAKIDGWLPRAHAPVIRAQFREIDRTLAGFVRGQATVCLVLGVGYALALQIAGLDYGLVVGLFAGLISFVPYVGSITGLLLSVGLAYAQDGASWLLVTVVAIFLVGQLFEGNYLTPKLVGEKVGLHAVWVMFALLAGGGLFGFVGILLAVPVAAVIGVLVRFALANYMKSRLYRGPDAGP